MPGACSPIRSAALSGNACAVFRSLTRGSAYLGLLVAAFALAGCARPFSHYAVQTAMTSAYRPISDATLFAQNGSLKETGETILAGDFHCHVRPPDHPAEASRSPLETVALASKEGLDFVVLTPHVPARFFEDDSLREWVLSSQADLRTELKKCENGRTVFIVGMEYTDHTYGHIGAAFADLSAVLADVSSEDAKKNPGLFFERFVKRGGLLVINHPLSTPLDSSFSMARADLSWRPFTSGQPVAPEIATVNHLAQGIEAYNMVVTH